LPDPIWHEQQDIVWAPVWVHGNKKTAEASESCWRTLAFWLLHDTLEEDKRVLESS
jgi:hypothetical protein